MTRNEICFLLVLTVSMAWQTVASVAAAPCPKEVCNTGQKCGDLLSLCSPEQNGKACNGCDGTTVIRVCSKSVQDRECTKKTTATTCGSKFTGTCTESSFGYFYCKKTAAGGSHSCDKTECTGDKACPAGS